MQIIHRLLELPFMQTLRGRRRGRLVRHYFFISAILIGGGLITSGLLEIYFRYKESLEQISLLQQEVTTGVAFKIERFIQEIQTTMKAATRSREVALKGLSPEYKFELQKLLLIEPAITEVVALDAHGIVNMQASRLRTVLAEGKRDLSKTAAFQQAKQGSSYFSPVYFVRDSEPYMSISVPIERFAGEVIGVLQAEVNLKYIWEVVSGIKVGKAGYAFAVSGSGDLIAHPDISLVLQRINVAQLDYVKAALQSTPGVAKPKAVVARNVQGVKVFSSYALIPSLNWAVFVERPVEEAYEPLYASIKRTSSVLLIGLCMALFASFFVARRVVRPLRTLRQGVERIGGGDLGYRLELKSGDEIEVLADEFNKMASQLQDSHANLEQRVEERTRDLAESLEQQTATSDVLRVIASSTTELQPVLDTVIASAVKLSGASQGHIRQYDGEFLRAVAHCNESPEQIAALRETLIRPVPEGLTGRAFLERRPNHVVDLQAEPGAHPNLALQTGQRTVLAVPLLREGTPIGTITIWRDFVEPFTERQIDLIKTFADQAVIAIENVRLFKEIQDKSLQLEAANKHKSQFLANVSHELRTPLNAIIGFTRMVIRKTGDQIAQLQKNNLQKVLISSEHLLSLINDLLDLAKIESGRMEVFAESFKVEEVIQVATSTVEPLLKDGRVRLITEINRDVPTLNTDRDKLKQSILNLLSNAAKFTEKGEIKVSAWQENGSLKLVVSDTGIGMKKEALENIFDEFRQVDMSSSRKFGGTGLGLAIVKRFVNLLGGDIGVESEEGKGSTFTITVPLSFQG